MTIDTITKSPTPTELVKKVNELVEGLNDGRASSIPVGHIYTIGYSELDAGQLPLLGGEYSRTTYADLWTWVQRKPSLLKTEAQWQTLKTASGDKGVPYYSAGNGTTTFRVPMFGCYIKGANSMGTVGDFLAAGLPNITGAISAMRRGHGEPVANGVFSSSFAAPGSLFLDGPGGIPLDGYQIQFNASSANNIYGKSATVQPDSMVQLYVVQAFGEVTNAGNFDMQELAVGLQEIETSKANVDLSNLSTSAKTQIGSLLMPNFAKQIVTTSQQFQCTYNSFIFMSCRRASTEDYRIDIGPQKGLDFLVGYRTDNNPDWTETNTFSFFCPAGWWVTVTDYGSTYTVVDGRIFPIIE